MTDKSDHHDIWTESMVFDYVAGHLDDKARSSFEERMQRDQSLRDAVESEQNLRAAMSQFSEQEMASVIQDDSNIDDLMQQIDALEVQEEENAADQNQATSAKPDRRNLYGIAGVAACMLVAVFVVVNQQSGSNINEYSLLSDGSSASTQRNDDFQILVAETRVAQLWLAKETEPDAVKRLLEQYNLTPLGRAGSAWIVSTHEPLTPTRIDQLSKIEEIERVSLITFGETDTE